MDADAIAADIRTLQAEPGPDGPGAQVSLGTELDAPSANIFNPDFEPRGHPARPGTSTPAAPSSAASAGSQRLGASVWEIEPGKAPTPTTPTSARRS